MALFHNIFGYLNAGDGLLIKPQLMLLIFGIGILLTDYFMEPGLKYFNALMAMAGVLFSGITLWQLSQKVGLAGDQIGFFNTLILDHFSIFMGIIFLAATALIILLSVRYMEIEQENHGEFYALMLFATIGMMFMVEGLDLIVQFIGLETMALSFYVLVGFLRRERRSNEAALKYLLLGAFSSGILAYGLSLFYGLSGSTNLQDIQRAVSGQNPHNPVVVIALLTTMTGLLFKIAAVPFHQWAPDAYEGAPTSITGFMSVAVKAAGWAMLLRILLWGLYPMRPVWVPLLVFVSIATMTGANFAALSQTNTKRLLAYSSIAHVGYMLLGLIAGTAPPLTADGIKGPLFYLLVYTFMNLGAFGVITSLR